jgi:hypothetical protein
VRTAAFVAATAAALALAACGESDEDKAQDRICDARADISRQLETLGNLTPSTATTDQVRDSVEAIGDDLKAMGEAQVDLNEDRRKEIQAANQAIASDLREIGSTVLRSTSVEEARAQLESSVAQLRQSYDDTLAKVDCG